MSPRAAALAHYRERKRLIRAIRRQARTLWRRLDYAVLDASWRTLSAELLIALAGAQLAAARPAGGYLDEVLVAQGLDPASVGAVAARALAGVSADGRELHLLLAQPVIAAKVAIGEGATQSRALATGYATLDMIVRTEVADAGRVADQVALTARPAVHGYVRMTVGKTCSRCLILAGKRYRWNSGFDRHPNDDCVHIPASEDTANDLRTDPKAAFAAMDRTEQDRVFTKAGAEAIRNGADMSQVVNARRGMYVAGERKFTTVAARRRPRLMPEQIFREADGNRDEALRLLRLHGYLI
jgi:hypothetical protein